MRILIYISLSLFIMGCTESPLNLKRKINLREVETYSEAGNLQMVVEIPAGSNHKYEYDYEQNKMLMYQKDGKSQIINFLPYPGNFGFIPHTKIYKKTGGAGDALNVLLLSETISSGQVVEIIPIGALLLMDNGEEDTKIIAVPRDSSLQIITATDFSTFLIEYDAAKRIIEEWFTHYKGNRQTVSLGWRNKAYCDKLIERVRVE